MSVTIADAILALNPKAEFKYLDDDISTLEWLSNHTGDKPTASQINTKKTELLVAEPKRLLRRLRTDKLKESDWMSNSDSPTMTDAWKTYRQALRDLPATQNPTLDDDENLDESSFTWPTEPS